MKQSIRIWILGILALFSVTPSMAALPAAVMNTGMTSLAPMLKRVTPSVVNISIVGEVQTVAPMEGEGDVPRSRGKNPASRNMQPHRFYSLGSGVIVNVDKGYILTNAHVLAQAQTITVTLQDGRHFKAKLIGEDKASDLAVLRIPARGLSSMPFANSDNLNVGDFVVAIGNPFGLHQTVTSGIISALQRDDLNIEGYENFIQTDASINPGNSGGALVNVQGQLIGINTAIVTPDTGNVGIGFAIPSNMARSVMDQLIKYGKVRRGLLGILVQNLTPELATAFGINELSIGAVVTEVQPHTPAADGGLKSGDIIQQVNGSIIKNAYQIRNLVGVLPIGSYLHIRVLRHGKPVSLSIVIMDPKGHQPEALGNNPLLVGLELQDYRQQTVTNGLVSGVLVVNATQDSPAILSGLRPGDVITDLVIDGQFNPVHSIEELTQVAVTQRKSRDTKHFILRVLRGPGGAFFIPIMAQQND